MSKRSSPSRGFFFAQIIDIFIIIIIPELFPGFLGIWQIVLLVQNPCLSGICRLEVIN
jgi:hypothetical protein